MRDSGLFFLSFRSAFLPVLLACALRFSVHSVGLMPCADTDVAEGRSRFVIAPILQVAESRVVC